ncbi:hypothetical protein HU200_012956 [Digitaria exilis]|uniref:ADF-H domain-containing protein n=1 Tax=Digitaria exilis TaxID=1010633 RepID=A0A835KK00_9POAL|nr:hypothetical protein HU200_012956 [Digitaria exilis]
MVYASSCEGFKKELDGVQIDLQATEPSELTLDIGAGCGESAAGFSVCSCGSSVGHEMFYFRIARSPSTAKVRSKMLYASSNQKFKSGLNGIQVELQATDASEISLDEIKDRAR